MQLSELATWLAPRKNDIEAFLKTLVEINTHTSNTSGVDRGMDVLSQFAQDQGLTVEVVSARGRLIKATKGSKRPRILLIAHMDTVFAPDSGFDTYHVLGDGFVRGPGVGDIKGGLLIGLWSMLAIRELFDEYDVQLVVSADEESGSPTIRDWYMGGHVGADYAIGLEPGFPQGDLSATVPLGVVIQRRGYALINFTVKGKSCHSGVPQDGLSAIDALGHRIVALQALNDYERGVTVNVGLVNGGVSPNTVAGTVKAAVSFRYFTMQDGQATKDAIEDILSRQYIYNPAIDLWDSVEMTTEAFIPPMEKTPLNLSLADIVLEEAAHLKHNVVPLVRGGGSDANFISATGIPTICGMGAPAYGIHTQEEMIYLPMMYERITLLTRTIARLINEHPIAMKTE